jgi:hypothetical protein
MSPGVHSEVYFRGGPGVESDNRVETVNDSHPSLGEDGAAPAAVLAAVAYLLAAIAAFAPALPDLTASFPGGLVAGVDGWQNVWHLWWAQRALASGQNPLFTPLLYQRKRESPAPWGGW